jgi:steroid delta-isomerase-like uncharacterized protein
MSQELKDLVRRYYEEVWNAGNIDAVDEYVAPDWVDHNAHPLPGRTTGAGAVKQLVTMVKTGFPDFHRTIEDQICDEDVVVTRFTDRGTHQGPFMGIAATGKATTITGMHVERISEGKVREVWHIRDIAGLLEQIGAGGGSS